MDDLISRQAAIDAIRKIYDSVGILGEKWAVDKCQMAIKDLPSAEPEIKPSVTSTTKKCNNVGTDYAACDQFVCSNCGIELQDWRRVERDEDGDTTYHEYEFRFCPNCGAKL